MGGGQQPQLFGSSPEPPNRSVLKSAVLWMETDLVCAFEWHSAACRPNLRTHLSPDQPSLLVINTTASKALQSREPCSSPPGPSLCQCCVAMCGMLCGESANSFFSPASSFFALVSMASPPRWSFRRLQHWSIPFS